ncbi:MAG TPA: hypothetical protein VJ455_05945 [Ignavibacteria bacterium]|nr:hypothetical protein [Ignavibacteria bacterium]
MNTLRFIVLIFLFILTVSLQSQTELNWNIIYKLTSAKNDSIGDVPGHVMGSAEGIGLGFFTDKSVGIMSGYFTFDYINGSGNFQAYYTLSFDDGSAFTIKTINTTALYEPKLEKTSFEGGIEFVSGKGRFAAISGKGTLKGKRTMGIETGAAVYLEINSTYELYK